jgi:peroxiredoxin Q/BCP
LRDHYPEFERRSVAIVAVAPDDMAGLKETSEELDLPFPILANETREVFLTYDVQSTAWSLGQRPAVYLIDPTGTVRWAYQGTQQWDIPKTSAVLAAVDTFIARDQKALERRK